MSDRLLIVRLDLSPYAAAMREHSSGAFLGEGSIQRKHDCSVCIDLPLPSSTLFSFPPCPALLPFSIPPPPPPAGACIS